MRRHVLIIDDTKNIRLMLTKCLELEGYAVESAANGKEGLEMVCGNRYDLIFLDIKLPEMSGTEVLRRMRAADVQTPVVVITAYPTIKNAVECTRLGVVSYLQKPFTADRLKNVLYELEQNNDLAAGSAVEMAQNAIRQGDGVRALGILGTALGQNPQNAGLYAMIAEAYQVIGDMDSAEKFRKAAEIFQSM